MGGVGGGPQKLSMCADCESKMVVLMAIWPGIYAKMAFVGFVSDSILPKNTSKRAVYLADSSFRYCLSVYLPKETNFFYCKLGSCSPVFATNVSNSRMFYANSILKVVYV